MSTNYPSGTDSLTNPAGTQTLDNPSHSTQHTNINDAMEAVQTTTGTTAGTNVLKHFAAGEFPVRATGVAATGTLQQTLVGGTFNKNTLGSVGAIGGTFNNATVGTPAITGGTSVSTLIVGTDILSLAGLLGTSGIRYVENNTQGTYTNTSYNNGTNIGSISFTPLVPVRVLVFGQLVSENKTTGANDTVDLQINGTSEAVGASGVDWLSMEQGTSGANTFASVFGVHYGTSTLNAGGTHSVIARLKTTSSGTIVRYRAALLVIPLPAT